MLFEPKEVKLKDGRMAVFRVPEVEDAQIFLDYLKITAAETPYLIRTPEECTMTLEQEQKYLSMARDGEFQVTVCCFVDGRLAGNCNLARMNRVKTQHRGVIGIALMQDFWGLGIGTAMFEDMIEFGRQWGLKQLELEVMDGNVAAMGLYRKMGFRTVATRPNAFCVDGCYYDEHLMVKEL